MIQIRHKTWRGGSGIQAVPDRAAMRAALERLHRQRLSATAEEDGREIGWVWQRDDNGRWTWCCET